MHVHGSRAVPFPCTMRQPFLNDIVHFVATSWITICMRSKTTTFLVIFRPVSITILRSSD
jgi:hypothetical protein